MNHYVYRLDDPMTNEFYIGSRRLYADFEKDEAEKLSTIRKQFPKEFRMTKEDYDDEILKFRGTLLQLYRHCEIKYGKKLRIQSKRGRPRKI